MTILLEKKRIAIVNERIYPYYQGGAEKVVYDYAKILAQVYDVTVFTSFDQGMAKERLSNVEFTYVSNKVKQNNKYGNHSMLGILSFSNGATLHRQKIQNFDLVILDSIHYFYPLLFLKFLRKRNGKVVTIFHEAWYEYRKSKAVSPIVSYFMGIFIKRLIRSSDKIISISDPTTKSLINNYSAEKNDVITIPLGIDYMSIMNKHLPKNTLDRKYDLVFVGRFAAIKRVGDIVKAVSLLTKSGMKLEVALIGDGPVRGLLEKEIENLDLRDSFHVKGFLSEDQKYRILADSKIFILPSEREGFSLATLEAMAMGCVPIVSQPHFREVFGVSDFVKDQFNGIYYNIGNISELVNSIISLFKSPNRMIDMSTQAKETAKLYSNEIMKEKLLKTVGTLLT